MMFEEILHRIPKAQRLEVLLCGPELNAVRQTDRPGGVAMNMATCPWVLYSAAPLFVTKLPTAIAKRMTGTVSRFCHPSA